jgi:nucleotide-binding universal stress UspA family protein
MYERILLAYDGSLESRSALREGALLAMRYGSKIFLLAVMPVSSGVYLAEGAAAGTIDQMEAAYQRVLDDGLTRLKDNGFNSSGALARGDPSKVISEYAKATQADLVVLGHRKQSFVNRWWAGASGGYLIDQLDCTILICRNTGNEAKVAAELERLRGAPA